MRRLDRWLQRWVFHPPLIAFCQWAGYTQHKLHRDLWFAGSMAGLWNVRDSGWGVFLVAAFIAFVFGLRAMFTPATWPSHSAGFLRGLALVTFALLSPLALIAGSVAAPIYLLLITLAEYAATIPTIPPRKRRPKRLARKAYP